MRLIPLALAGALALSTAGASLAQPAPPPGGPAGGHAWQWPDPAEMAQRHAERLQAILQLRPEQEPALRAFIAAMQPSPEQMQRREAERGEARDLTTPQRLDRMQARLAERQTEFARHADAIKRFYAQLSPAQQKAFDALPMPHHGMGGGMGGHMGGHMHGGPGFGPARPPGVG